MHAWHTGKSLNLRYFLPVVGVLLGALRESLDTTPSGNRLAITAPRALGRASRWPRPSRCLVLAQPDVKRATDTVLI
jgi:hypothetical protein